MSKKDHRSHITDPLFKKVVICEKVHKSKKKKNVFVLQKKFREKSQVFLWGKNDSRKKKAIVLETLFGVAFFLENHLKKKQGEAKNQSNDTIPFPRTNI